MSGSAPSSIWQPMRDELARWAEIGRVPSLWLRDDDTIEATPALRRLATMAGDAGAPILVAIIPARAADHLSAFFAERPLLDPAVHGCSHRNHAGAGEKTQEFPISRGAAVITAELVAARQRLGALFGTRLSPIYVPPWNRIGAEVAALLPTAGFTAMSGFGAKALMPPGARLLEINTHVDIIDWKGSRGGREAGWLAREVAVQLTEARAAGRDYVGILTHHLVHDAPAWGFLSALFEEVRRHPQVRWRHAGDLMQHQRDG